MPHWLYIGCVVYAIFGIDPRFGGSHRITGLFPSDSYSRTFLERTLFTRNTSEPQSYVVGFKYVGDIFSRVIISGEIWSDAADTWSTGDLSNGLEITDNHYLNARMDITNASNFKVDISVSGAPGMGQVYVSRFLKVKLFRPRSSALICRKSNYKTPTPYREIVFGERKDGDFIVYAERKNISATETHLPRHKIEFRDNNVVLTAATIRLNSTMAIVFRNKVELSEHQFVGTIYGLIRDTISSVVIIIYGYRT